MVAQVESGRIDMAHHHNYAKLALRELSELEEAILAALQLVKLEETLVIVTADHSHAFTINGYPKRGNDILGFANDPAKPNVPAYETLSYINGPGFFYHRRNDSSNVNETWRPVDLRRAMIPTTLKWLGYIWRTRRTEAKMSEFTR